MARTVKKAMKMFRTRPALHWMTLVAFLAGSGVATSATVTSQTLLTWQEHVDNARAELAKGLSRPDRFIRLEQDAGKRESVRSGDILAAHAPEGGLTAVPSGLVHHWIGAVFIGEVRASDVIAVLQNYDGYAGIYSPAVVESSLSSRAGDEFKYRLKFQNKGFGVKAKLLGDFRSEYFKLDAATGYSVTVATDLTELANAETSEERPLTTAQARVYVERIFTIVRYRECESGVLVEVETLTLSRDIPGSVRWLASPLIQRFSRNVMISTLDRLRNKVEATRGVESAARR